MTRPVTLDDIEAALRYRFPVSPEDMTLVRSLVTAYAEAEGLALARRRVLERRQASLVSANGLNVTRDDTWASVLREAYARASLLRASGLPVPPGLAELDREYKRERKRAQRRALATQAPELDAEAGEVAAA